MNVPWLGSTNDATYGYLSHATRRYLSHAAGYPFARYACSPAKLLVECLVTESPADESVIIRRSAGCLQHARQDIWPPPARPLIRDALEKKIESEAHACLQLKRDISPLGVHPGVVARCRTTARPSRLH